MRVSSGWGEQMQFDEKTFLDEQVHLDELMARVVGIAVGGHSGG